MMSSAQAVEDALFRVRAAGSDHWVVYRDAAEEPVASFGDKASALAYALHLAHRRPNQSTHTLVRSEDAYGVTRHRDPH